MRQSTWGATWDCKPSGMGVPWLVLFLEDRLLTSNDKFKALPEGMASTVMVSFAELIAERSQD